VATDGVSITGDPDHRRVSIERDGQTLAAADVDSTGGPAVVYAVLAGQVRPLSGASGARLVDAVLGLPEVAGAAQLDAAVPAVDAEMVQQLREGTDGLSARLAGGTVLITAHPRPATVPPPASGPAEPTA